MKQYDTYIFDLYGTLVDIHTEEGKPALWNTLARFLRMKGYPVRADGLRAHYWALCRRAQEAQDAKIARMGLQGPGELELLQVWEQLFPQMSVQELRDISCLFRTLSTEKLRLFPGAGELLGELRQAGKRIYLLSNAQSCFTLPELGYLGLRDCFDGILLSSDAGVKKPSPDFFRLLLEKYRLDPETAVMVGNDDGADCWGAAGVGLDSLYIPTEQSPKPAGPLPDRCRQVADLFEILRGL